MVPSADAAKFRAVLRQSKHVVAIAGAGLSAASGLPTFRGAGGLWRSFDATLLATPEAFESNPSRVWQFYHMRREAAMKVEPNAAHEALAKFSVADLRRSIAPVASFHLVTQNVDGLSVRALERVTQALGDSPLSDTDVSHTIEMHGRLLDTICTLCSNTVYDESSPICEGLAGTEQIMELKNNDVDPIVALDELPHCAICQGLLRPGVVWFGEMPKQLEEIDELVEEADLAIVVGASSTVYPAAGYASHIKRRGGTVAVFNLERSAGDHKADFLFLGPCEKTIPEVMFGEFDTQTC